MSCLVFNGREGGGFGAALLVIVLSLAISIGCVSHAAADVAVTGVLTESEIPFFRVSRYEIVVEAPAGAEVVVLPWPEPIPGLEARLEPALVNGSGGGAQQFLQTLVIAPIAPREYELPQVVVQVDGRTVATLEPGKLKVRAATPEEEADLAAPEGLISLAELDGESGGGGAAVLAAIVVLLVVGGLVFLLFRGRGVGLARRELGPLEEALEALGRIEGAVHRGEAGGDDVYTTIAEATRLYLDRSFALHLRELSTPEIARGALLEMAIPREVITRLIELLRESDRVKFAQAERTKEAQLGAIDEARGVIDAFEHAVAEIAGVRGAA